MCYTVIEVIDGDTFDVDPEWGWDGEQGKRVRPTGYNAPETTTIAGLQAKTRLEKLLLDEKVELINPVRVDRGCLVCAVIHEGVNLASYFPEY